ncbi:Flp pilus assembly protein TadD, contains TPR repeat [hydrothermal vent metagenome]|uniref:Flp pilus assembly protein TadD, contains TPR repeat n=1 Tax=hydrothermal vent metagenome TaxID=652676 RepID=A0A3B0U4D4_9ZZZZ
MAAVLLALGGCTGTGFGGPSVFGGSPAQIADISGLGNYTAAGALVEARNYFRTGNFGYSAAYYKKATELSPQNAEGYVGLAASYDRLGRFDLSDRVYRALLRISGQSVQYYNNVGYSYMLRGNLSAALVNFRKAASLDPKNIVVANNLQLLADAAAAA